jgi:hypothetical protein
MTVLLFVFLWQLWPFNKEIVLPSYYDHRIDSKISIRVWLSLEVKFYSLNGFVSVYAI